MTDEVEPREAEAGRRRRPLTLGWVRGEARAFDGRWYPVKVVLVGPRSARVISAAGDVGDTVQVRLAYDLPEGDTSWLVLGDWLARAGYRDVSFSPKVFTKNHGAES